MNLLERYVHARVAEYPKLRVPLVAAYQRLMALVPRADVLPNLPMRRREGTFFGFHDKCPWSADGSLLLGHAFDTGLSQREAEAKPVRIGLLDPETLQFHDVTTSRTWNWQQGAMLQWVGSDNAFIYNDIKSRACVARVMDTDGATLAEFPLHVASTSPNGRIGLGYSFARMKVPATEYAYRCGSDPTANESLPTDDGIHLLDLETGRSELILSLADVASRFPDPTMSGAYHYFTHTVFSPSGHRFMFMHRWLGRYGVLHTRLLSATADGDDLHEFPVTQASHICWRDDDSVFAYCRPYNQDIGYYLLTDRSGTWRFAGGALPRCDGHPQFTGDGRYLVTDTYPDRSRMQSLVVHDAIRQETQTLLSVKISFEYRYGRRCDFHPRWSRDASQVCFDSAHTGTRSMYVVDLDQSDLWV
jgi:hypothetical protein